MRKDSESLKRKLRRKSMKSDAAFIGSIVLFVIFIVLYYKLMTF